jgi:hypothetical protein
MDIEQRTEIFLQVKKRIDILTKACSDIRMLNGVFVMIAGKGLFIDLTKLIASWDRDTRPDLNGLLIQYLDSKNYLFLDNKFNKIEIENLSNNDLFQLHLYFEQVVPVNFNIPD